VTAAVSEFVVMALNVVIVCCSFIVLSSYVPFSFVLCVFLALVLFCDRQLCCSVSR